MDILLSNKDLVPMIYQDLKSLLPLLGQYLKPTEFTVREMADSMNKLRSRMLCVVHKLEEVCVDNGWSPRDSTIEWIRKGLDCHRRVHVIGNRYLLLLGAGSGDGDGDGGGAAESMLRCPCHAVLSSRQINMEALKLIVDVTGHYAEGETYEEEDYETVAIPGRKRSDVLQELNDLMPKVKQLERFFYEEVFWRCRYPGSSYQQQISAGEPEFHLCSASAFPGSSSELEDFTDDDILVCASANEPEAEAEDLPANDLELSHNSTQVIFKSMENIGKLDLSAFSMYRALPRSEEEASTPVMIRVKGPRYTYGARSPIDLVLVLDITAGSMAGEKLSQIKQGAMFVLRNLQADDRLSVVLALDKCTHMIFPLMYLADEETKEQAKTKIAELPSVAAPSDITLAPAMEAVHQILTKRALTDGKQRLARVMVLTDGGLDGKQKHGVICEDYPTYTFGLGPEHDRWKTYGVASQGRGTYSFDSTPDLKSIGAAMALCVGGLTSIAAHRVFINIHSEYPGVSISRITSGAYDNCVIENGRLGSITVDDIYNSEEKNFLVYVNIPRDEAAGGGFFFPRTTKTKLLTMRGHYYSHVSNSFVDLDHVEVSVERKGYHAQASSQADEVANEVLRARVLEEVAKIAASKEAGSDLPDIISTVRANIEDTPEAKAAKDTWDSLSKDLDNMEDAETGLAFMLSWLTSHQWQRAAMADSMSEINFSTTRMKNLVDSVDLAPVDMLAGT